MKDCQCKTCMHWDNGTTECNKLERTTHSSFFCGYFEPMTYFDIEWFKNERTSVQVKGNIRFNHKGTISICHLYNFEGDASRICDWLDDEVLPALLKESDE